MMILRWLLLPVACVIAWYLACFVGISLLSFAESFCPEDQMVSGSCVAPWWPQVEAAVVGVSTALSATLVVASAFFVAPGVRSRIAWLVFAVGSAVAFWMAYQTSAWKECASAVVAGFATAFFLSRFARKTTPGLRLVVSDRGR